MKAKTETKLIADCHEGIEVNLVTALGFYSKFSSLESQLNLEQKHEMVIAISVEVFPGVLQTEQKQIGKQREAIEVEMIIRQNETYRRASVAVDVMSTKTIVDQAFSVPKCVRFARMSVTTAVKRTSRTNDLTAEKKKKR